MLKLIEASKEFQSAYIQAFADGEGTVVGGKHRRIEITQKDPSILYEIQDCLAKTFAIISKIKKARGKEEKYDCNRLFIFGQHNLRRYRDNISFRVEWKRNLLEEICSTYKKERPTYEDYHRALYLRSKGYTYREIKRELPFSIRTLQNWVNGVNKVNVLPSLIS